MPWLFITRPFSVKSKEAAIADILERALPDRDFYLLLLGAIFFAASAFFTDSLPLLIASMLVAPLSTPILALALGIAVGDSRVTTRASGILVLAILIVALTSASLSWIIHGVLAMGTERTFVTFSPNYFFDISIALAAGAIAAYGSIREKVGAAMTGIGIAVSLMPPLVAASIGFANSDPSLGMRGAIIFIMNVAGIVIASAATFVAFDLKLIYKHAGLKNSKF